MLSWGCQPVRSADRLDDLILVAGEWVDVVGRLDPPHSVGLDAVAVVVDGLATVMPRRVSAATFMGGLDHLGYVVPGPVVVLDVDEWSVLGPSDDWPVGQWVVDGTAADDAERAFSDAVRRVLPADDERTRGCFPRLAALLEFTDIVNADTADLATAAALR